MIKERIYTAKARTKAAKSVFLGLLGTSMIFVIAANIATKYSGIIWLVALGFVTATIYVYNRYVGAEYYYEVSDCGGRPSFIVSMRIGKTVRTMARVDLHSITEARKLNRAEYRAHKCEKGVLKYAYFPTMFSNEVYLLTIRSHHEKADLFIEADEDFISVITQDVVHGEPEIEI